MGIDLIHSLSNASQAYISHDLTIHSWLELTERNILGEPSDFGDACIGYNNVGRSTERRLSEFEEPPK